jgi:3-hydroxyisobutyrate dehydrogenase-like beta-hydroxyacid dehydrogenase
MKVAILGTGKMGAAMARRFHHQGYEVRLWNRTRSRAEQLGIGEVFDTPVQAVDGAELAISMLTDSAAVRQAYLGEGGAAQATGAPIYVDSSTVDPTTHQQIAQALAQRGSSFLEAPVVGSVPAVESGKLLILVGGDEITQERIRPLLEVLGEVRYVGPLGSGASLKLVANSMLGITSAAAGELLNAALRAGLDRQRVWEILTRFVPYLDARRAGYLEGRYDPPMFRLADLLKDLNLARGLYGEVGIDTPLTETTRELVQRAATDHGEQDIAAIAELWREPAAARQPLR